MRADLLLSARGVICSCSLRRRVFSSAFGISGQRSKEACGAPVMVDPGHNESGNSRKDISQLARCAVGNFL